MTTVIDERRCRRVLRSGGVGKTTVAAVLGMAGAGAVGAPWW